MVKDEWTRPFPTGQHYERFVDKDAGYLVVRRVVPPGSTGVVAATPLSTSQPMPAAELFQFVAQRDGPGAPRDS